MGVTSPDPVPPLGDAAGDEAAEAPHKVAGPGAGGEAVAEAEGCGAPGGVAGVFATTASLVGGGAIIFKAICSSVTCCV